MSLVKRTGEGGMQQGSTGRVRKGGREKKRGRKQNEKRKKKIKTEGKQRKEKQEKREKGGKIKLLEKNDGKKKGEKRHRVRTRSIWPSNSLLRAASPHRGAAISSTA